MRGSSHSNKILCNKKLSPFFWGIKPPYPASVFSCILQGIPILKIPYLHYLEIMQRLTLSIPRYNASLLLLQYTTDPLRSLIAVTDVIHEETWLRILSRECVVGIFSIQMTDEPWTSVLVADERVCSCGALWRCAWNIAICLLKLCFPVKQPENLKKN